MLDDNAATTAIRSHLDRHPLDASALTEEVRSGSLGRRIRRRRRRRSAGLLIGAAVATIGVIGTAFAVDIPGENIQPMPAIGYSPGPARVGDGDVRCGMTIDQLTPRAVDVQLQAKALTATAADSDFMRAELTMQNLTDTRITGSVYRDLSVLITQNGRVIAFPQGHRDVARGVVLAPHGKQTVEGTLNLRLCRPPGPADPAKAHGPLPPGDYQAYAVTEIIESGPVVRGQAFGGPWTLTVR